MRGLWPLACLGLALLGGRANTIDRIAHVGQAPELTPIGNPVAEAGYRSVSLPMPAQEPEVYPANSLWRQGACSFFKDQRARTVGDVLTVEVTIADEATLRNETQRTRDNEDNLSASHFFGLESRLDKIFPNAVDPDNLVDLNGELLIAGRGNTARTEEIRLNVAAVVTQVLQSGDPETPGGSRELRGASCTSRGSRGARTSARTTRSSTTRSPSCASPTAAAARSPTSSSRATAPRCWTSSCRIERDGACRRRRRRPGPVPDGKI